MKKAADDASKRQFANELIDEFQPTTSLMIVPADDDLLEHQSAIRKAAKEFFQLDLCADPEWDRDDDTEETTTLISNAFWLPRDARRVLSPIGNLLGFDCLASFLANLHGVAGHFYDIKDDVAKCFGRRCIVVGWSWLAGQQLVKVHEDEDGTRVDALLTKCPELGALFHLEIFELQITRQLLKHVLSGEHAALGSEKCGDAASFTKTSRELLREYLSHPNQLLKLLDLQNQLCLRSIHLDYKTIQKHNKTLIESSIVHRPKGDRGGATLTDLGKRVAAECWPQL